MYKRRSTNTMTLYAPSNGLQLQHITMLWLFSNAMRSCLKNTVISKHISEQFSWEAIRLCKAQLSSLRKILQSVERYCFVVDWWTFDLSGVRYLKMSSGIHIDCPNIGLDRFKGG